MKRLPAVVGVMLASGAILTQLSGAQGFAPVHTSGGSHGGHGHGGFRGHGGGGFSNLNVWFGGSTYPGRYSSGFYGDYPPGFAGYPYPLPAAYGYPVYPYAPGYYGGNSYLGPLYLPAESMYGPQALARFWGFGPGIPTAPTTNIVVMPNREVPAVVGVEEVAPARATNAQSVALCHRFIALGDDYFGNQKYVSAYQRYAEAISAGPRESVAYLRQGISLVALGRYVQASRVLKRGVALDAGMDGSNFRLDNIYGANRMAKQAHLDALAKAAGDQPGDPDLLFLVGILVHFDGQSDRARPFFQRAAQLVGNDHGHLDPFLD